MTASETVHRVMFWTDWGKQIIAKAGMDGSNPQVIVHTNIEYPNGIAIDYHNSRLYWTDAKQAAIESIKLDGSDRRVREIFTFDYFPRMIL